MSDSQVEFLVELFEENQSLRQHNKAKAIRVKAPKSLAAILAQEHASLAHIRGTKTQGLQILNPGELSGELKDPDGTQCAACCE